MSFELKLYKNKSRKNERVKNLEEIETMSGTLKSECSIIDPIIRIESTTNLKNCNYMYISNFGRYYFIKDIVHVRNNIYEIVAHCDVLSSSSSALLNCVGIIRRQENAWNLYLDDGAFKVYSNPNVVQKAFPSGFSTSNLTYILAVAGS